MHWRPRRGPMSCVLMAGTAGRAPSLFYYRGVLDAEPQQAWPPPGWAISLKPCFGCPPAEVPRVKKESSSQVRKAPPKAPWPPLSCTSITPRPLTTSCLGERSPLTEEDRSWTLTVNRILCDSMHRVRSFLYFLLFHIIDGSILLFPFRSRGNVGSEKLMNLPRITQL